MKTKQSNSNGIGGVRVMMAVAAVFLCACGACGTGAGAEPASSPPTRLVVAAWNVQTLFDGREDGTEYPDYSAASGWTEAKYRERLAAIGRAVPLFADGGPDVLALIEVENEGVARDLAAGPLAGLGYGWYARAGQPGASLGLAVLSRYPVIGTRAHGAVAEGEALPRPVLEVRIDAGGVPLVLLVCHWKSKLGGDAETEPQRAAAAAVVARRLAELAGDEPGIDALVVGDLNENYDEFERRGSASITALLPDDPAAARLVRDAGLPGPFLVLSEERPPLSRALPGAVAVRSPWPDSEWPGSYVHRGAWETIDHALLPAGLFDGRGWEYAAYRVIDADILMSDARDPLPYNPRTGSGYSDHLPLAVELLRTP